MPVARSLCVHWLLCTCSVQPAEVHANMESRLVLVAALNITQEIAQFLANSLRIRLYSWKAVPCFPWHLLNSLFGREIRQAKGDIYIGTYGCVAIVRL